MWDSLLLLQLTAMAHPHGGITATSETRSGTLVALVWRKWIANTNKSSRAKRCANAQTAMALAVNEGEGEAEAIVVPLDLYECRGLASSHAMDQWCLACSLLRRSEANRTPWETGLSHYV